MREVLQWLHGRGVELGDVSPPQPRPGHVLIESAASVVSPGTERMVIEFAQAGWIGKVRQQPDRLRDLADKARADGLKATVGAVRSRLDQPITLGYANAGYVVGVGSGVQGIQVGDLVASNGPHADYVTCPKTLAVPVPKGLQPEDAAFATLGAIALQSVRLAEPTLGERFVVMGLGLIGLLTVQALRAAGCEVLSFDFHSSRRRIAADFGSRVAIAGSDAVQTAREFAPNGVDGVIIATSTDSDTPAHQAAQMCRRRGRIVLVGTAGLHLQRADFYEKELTLQVSCSYGPGRYDPLYEESATDYPEEFVRWTAGRNMSAFLDLVQSGRVRVDSLVTHSFPIERAEQAYEALTTDKSSLAILLTYPRRSPSRGEGAGAQTGHRPAPRHHAQTTKGSLNPKAEPRIGIIGAGHFARATMLPALKSLGSNIQAIASRDGTSASIVAQQYDIPLATNDPENILGDSSIDVVMILTRHDSHAELAAQALEMGKSVFVEKPLAIDAAGLSRVTTAWNDRTGRSAILGIGFNRRFAPTTARMAAVLAETPGTRAVQILINAGQLERRHWTNRSDVGGGRLVGEACHFIDLSRFLCNSPIIDVVTRRLGAHDDTASIILTHDDGSISTIGYYSNGSRRFPKEQITVFAGGKVLVNDNFRRLQVFTNKRLYRRVGLWTANQDKGHRAGISAFLSAVKNGHSPPIAAEEIFEVTAATLVAADLLPFPGSKNHTRAPSGDSD